MSWTRIGRRVGLAGVTLFVTTAFTPLPNLLSRWAGTPSELEASDAIVVLGGSVWPDGVLSNSSVRRALHGIGLYRKGLAPLLVFLGPARSAGPSEAEVRAALARELGIPAGAILTEADARTTREEALRVKALLSPRGIRRILLVTNPLHMWRARHVFQRAGFEVHAAPADDFPNAADSPEGRLNLMSRVLGELFARLYYRVAGYL